MNTYIISHEELLLLSEEQLDVLDSDYWYEQWKLEKEAMETDYVYCK